MTAKASRMGRTLGDERVTMVVSRMCWPRCRASTDPSIPIQMKRVDASSSAQTIGLCRKKRKMTLVSSSTISTSTMMAAGMATACSK